METQQTITVRSLDLPLPTRIDPLVIEGQPELSCMLVAISLSLPYLEPFLIRTMNEAKRHIADPTLLEQIRLLNAQEGQHVRLHARFNKAVGQTFPALAALEKELADDCRRFIANRSLKWKLAYSESLEAFTVAYANFVMKEPVLRDMKPAPVRDLFDWHAVEELEHRSVAFDVYERLYGDYPYRVAVSLYAQWHFMRFVIRATRLMLAHDRAQGRDHGRPSQIRGRVLSLLGQFGRGMLPGVLASHLPGYRPQAISAPPSAGSVLARIAAYDTRAPAASASASASASVVAPTADAAALAAAALAAAPRSAAAVPAAAAAAPAAVAPAAAAPAAAAPAAAATPAVPLAAAAPAAPAPAPAAPLASTRATTTTAAPASTTTRRAATPSASPVTSAARPLRITASPPLPSAG